MVSEFRKPRADAKLPYGPDQDEDRLQLLQWLCTPGVSYLQVRKLCAKPRSEGGLEIETSVGALCKFWQTEGPRYLIARRREAKNTVDALAEEAKANPAAWDAATIDLLRQQAYALAQNPNVNPKDVKAIFSLVLKAGAQDIDREKLELAKRKAEQADAAKALVEDDTLSAEQREQRLKNLFSIGG